MNLIDKFAALENIFGAKNLLWEIIQAMTDVEKLEYIEWICGNHDINEENLSNV